MCSMNDPAIDPNRYIAIGVDNKGRFVANITLGRPMFHDKMQTVSATIPTSRVNLMNDIVKREGIKRSEFIRRAIDKELLNYA